MSHHDDIVIGTETVRQGETRDVSVEVSQVYSGASVRVPVRITRAETPGPTVFITGAVHGDEVNGTGIVRELLLNAPFKLCAGSLILVPVVNVLAFDRHSRYLPDRRDLNRCFPGAKDGSLARRYAHTIFDTIVRQCDFGIDLHTAAIRRTNFPNVRGDLRNPAIRRLAKAFGCELVVKSRGAKGTLRAAATAASCPTIILEAGEVWKIQPSIVELGVRGVRNALIELDMVKGDPVTPAFQAIIDGAHWIRADSGGMLQFHVSPGNLVTTGQPLATIADLFGTQQSVVSAREDGIVMGMTTVPAVTPGDPICHIAVPQDGLEEIRNALKGVTAKDNLHERVRENLATSVQVTEGPDQ